MKIVINACFGGFGISDAGFERLIKLGIPVRQYIEQVRDPATGLYRPEPLNDGEVIFDRDLTPESDTPAGKMNELMRRSGRYWSSWLDTARTHPLLIQMVEELGSAANGRHSSLKVIEIPDGVDYTIEEYDGNEHIAETHRTWGD